MNNQPAPYITSPNLESIGVVHGWFGRAGGVSKGPFDSLNGKKIVSDPIDNVITNRSIALTSLGLANSNGAYLVHEFGGAVVECNKPGEYRGYDAAFTTESGIGVMQTTADCGSIVLATADATCVGLVHSSWKTLNTKLIRDIVQHLRSHGQGEVYASLGPMICRDCYEFGPEATQLFEDRYILRTGSSYHVDLRGMILDQLAASGVRTIDDVGICTLEDEGYFSHRRAGAESGRNITVVARAF